MAKEKSTDSSACDPSKFSDEIKYLQEENNTKNYIIQTLLENQKSIQNTLDSRTLYLNRNEPKCTNHFILRKKTSSNIKTPAYNQITTSNSFDLLSENTENSLDVNNVISIEDNNAENFMRSYLANRLQHCKINNSFSELAKVAAGVSQGSISGPLLFNIFMNNIFLFL